MSKLFEAGKINGMALSNRFVRSATWVGMATDDGACTARLINTMAELAEGGIGMIITGHAYIRPEGKAGLWQLGVYKDELISGLQEMTHAVHKRGGKIVLQIAHAGFYGREKITGQIPLAPSIIEGLSESLRIEMTRQDIREVVDAFGEAAGRAKRAGFDGVQIHSAHGYLLSQFLSPAFNHRTDVYGGSVENRTRALLEVLQAVRKTVGRDYPVLVKLNSQDFLENGLTLEDSAKVGVGLSKAGIDAIELSGGVLTARTLGPSRMGIKSEAQEAYFRDGAMALRSKIHTPLILVGGIRSYGVAERLLEEGVADYVSMSRPFIREPGLVNRWRAGDLRKAACISDNQCFASARNGEGIYCVTERKGK